MNKSKNFTSRIKPFILLYEKCLQVFSYLVIIIIIKLSWVLLAYAFSVFKFKLTLKFCLQKVCCMCYVVNFYLAHKYQRRIRNYSVMSLRNRIILRLKRCKIMLKSIYNWPLNFKELVVN